MSNEKNMQTIEEVYQNRIEKYIDKVEDKPKMKNQLLVKEGQAALVLNGNTQRCIHLEGYVKLPNHEYIQIVNQMKVGFYLLPKGRLIVGEGKDNFFLGYKSHNSSGCLVLIHAVTETDDLLIASINDSVPVLIILDDADEDETNSNSVIYKNMEYLFNINHKDDVLTESVCEVHSDEWE